MDNFIIHHENLGVMSHIFKPNARNYVGPEKKHMERRCDVILPILS